MKYLHQLISLIKRKKMYLILSVLFLAIISTAIYHFGIRSNNTQQSTESAEVTVKRGEISVTVSGTGSVVPIEEETITSTTGGTIKKLYVKKGELLNEGDLIAELDSDSLELQLQKAQLELEKARYDLNDLSGQKTQATITAPFAGRITSLEVKAGEEVNKNMVLAVLQNDSQLVFDMPITGEAAAKIKPNQAVNVFLVDRGDYIEGKVISNDGQAISGYNGQARSNVRVGIPVKGNLAPGNVVFGSITINGEEIDALATSKLEWLGDTELKAEIAGELANVNVKQGQVVKAGQTIFIIKDDSATTTQKGLELSYEQARLNLEDLKRQQEDLKITAGISGVISGMDAAEGDEILGGTKSSNESNTASTTSTSVKTLGKIINSKQVSISFPVDEVDITKVKLDQVATVEVDALPGKTFKGKVTEIAEEGVVQNNVSTFDVTINIENQDKLLKSGMTANITIITERKNNVLLIPIEALQQSNRGNFVMLAQKQGFRRQVKVGLTNESFAEITSGLEEGERITLPVLAAATTQNRQGGGFGGGGMRIPGAGGRAR